MKAVLVIFLLLVIAYFPAFFQQHTFYFGDNYSLLVTGKLFSAESLKEGVFPFWNSLTLSGHPFLADINQSILYPTTMLFMYLPTWIAVNATVLIHFFIGAFGVYCIVKRRVTSKLLGLIAAIVWLFSFQVVISANNLASVQTQAWLPWIYYFVIETLEKKSQLPRFFLTLTLVLSILAGHPQPLFYILIFIGLFAFFHPSVSFVEKAKRFSIPILSTIGVLAIVLMPFVEFSSLSTRTQMSAESVLTGSLRPSQLITWIIPNFFTNLSAGLAWGPAWATITNDSGYISLIGLIAVILFVRKKNKSYEEKFVLTAAGISIIVALGRYIPFVPQLYEMLPPLRLFRNPVIALWIWTLSAAILIGPALSYLSTVMKKPKRYLFYSGAVFVIGLFILLFTQHLWFTGAWLVADQLLGSKLSQSSFHTVERDYEIARWVLYNGIIVSASTLLAVRALTMKKRRWLVVFCIITVDLLFASRSSILLAPKTIYDGGSAQAEFLRKNLQPGERYVTSTGYLPWSGFATYWENIAVRPPFQDSRFTYEEQQTFDELKRRQANLGPNWGQLEKVPSPFGFSTFVLSSSAEYWKTHEGTTNVNEVDMPNLDDPRYAEQSVKYFVLDTTIYPISYMLEKYPDLTVVHTDEQFAVLELPSTQPYVRSEVTEVEVSNIEIGRNKISFAVTSPAVLEGEVTIAERFYPGWTCESSAGNCAVSEHPTGMQVNLDSLPAEVTLRFLPTNWSTLLWISAISGVGLLLFGLFAWKKDQKR